jgi:hypothetical protein
MPVLAARRKATAPMFGPLSTRRYTANGVDFDMVQISPGRFISLLPEDYSGVKQQTLLSYPFEIGLFQVSAKLWQQIVPGLQNEADDEIKRRSIYRSLDLFCEHLSTLGIGFFRLPTTAELIWAAHCGVPATFGSSDRFEFRYGPNAIKSQGDGEVGAAGVFDQFGGLSDISCERRLGGDADYSPLSMIDPVLSLTGPDPYQRRAMGGLSSKLTPTGLAGVSRRFPHPYMQTHRNVEENSIQASFRLVRVSPSLRLEAY